MKNNYFQSCFSLSVNNISISLKIIINRINKDIVKNHNDWIVKIINVQKSKYKTFNIGVKPLFFFKYIMWEITKPIIQISIAKNIKISLSNQFDIDKKEDGAIYTNIINNTDISKKEYLSMFLKLIFKLNLTEVLIDFFQLP